MMKCYFRAAVTAAFYSIAVLPLSQSTQAQSEGGDADAPVQGPKLENLLTTELEGTEGREVIVSRVTIPPNSALPKHWHPGEEFAYVLEGSLVLWQDGEAETTFATGEAGKVPLKKVHSARTTDEGATVLVFRVHERGQPERHMVE